MEAHSQEGRIARKSVWVMLRVGREYIPPEGFLGDMFPGKPVWAAGFEEHGMKAGFPCSSFPPPQRARFC